MSLGLVVRLLGYTVAEVYLVDDATEQPDDSDDGPDVAVVHDVNLVDWDTMPEP